MTLLTNDDLELELHNFFELILFFENKKITVPIYIYIYRAYHTQRGPKPTKREEAIKAH